MFSSTSGAIGRGVELTRDDGIDHSALKEERILGIFLGGLTEVACRSHVISVIGRLKRREIGPGQSVSERRRRAGHETNRKK